jgi:histidinol-phosphate/aromatic aminotransferase/cobyric acid decarboxylase-like protein
MLPSVSVDDVRPAPRAQLRPHGGLSDAELRRLGVADTEVLDLSVNCNPHGPCAAVVDAIRAAPLDRYPDPAAAAARRAIAAAAGTGLDHVALGNGAAELLWTLAAALIRSGRPGRSALIVEPTFGELRAAVEHAGGVIHEVRARPDDGFSIDLGAVERAIREHGAALAYLCTPNTPTGVAVAAERVRDLATALPGTTFLVDQSFLSLSERFADAGVPQPANVACVRSLTKDFAIPGVRVGYVIGDPALIARVERGRPAWTTSAAAQAAAIAACSAGAFVAESRQRVLAERARLVVDLRALGLSPVPSTTGFVAVRTGDARGLRQRLLANHRIAVRDCASFGLPDHIRLAAPRPADHKRVIAALSRELAP